MQGRLGVLVVAFMTGIVPSWAIADDAADKMSTLLMPPSRIDSTAKLDVDWDIDDMNAPDTPFEKAVAPRLVPLGVTGSISATYELADFDDHKPHLSQSCPGKVLPSLEWHRSDNS